MQNAAYHTLYKTQKFQNPAWREHTDQQAKLYVYHVRREPSVLRLELLSVNHVILENNLTLAGLFVVSISDEKVTKWRSTMKLTLDRQTKKIWVHYIKLSLILILKLIPQLIAVLGHIESTQSEAVLNVLKTP